MIYISLRSPQSEFYWSLGPPFKVNLSPNVIKGKLKVKHRGGKDLEMT